MSAQEQPTELGIDVVDNRVLASMEPGEIPFIIKAPAGISVSSGTDLW